jgi:transcriptional regulator of arginine metabolism
MRNFIRLHIPMPSATAEQRNERRLLIARLLRDNAVERQSQLVELLRAQGYSATQSSVSRDLKDMGAIKLKTGYSLPEHVAADDGDSLREITEFVRDIRAAGPNLLVLKTAVGAAQRVAVTLDRINWPEIVGTLSGDDTIFIATSSSSQQRRLRARLRQSFKRTS